MSDQTPDPIDVIANIPLVWGGETPTRMMLDRHDAEVVVNALTNSFWVTPFPTPTEGVCAYQWTDQWKPTAPASMSSRQAAMEILAHIDWATVIEDLVMFEDMDPLVYYGLRSELFETKWLDGRWFMGGKVRSHLTAWATSWMKIRSWCVNEDHHDGDMIPFNDCFHGDDDESPCEWGYCWALDGDPDDFLRLAMDLLRDGWEPPTDRPVVEALREWKSSAMQMLAEWDLVFDALGRPGKLGASKAESALTEVERMTAAGLRTAALADDATRQEVEAIEWALRHVPTAVGSGVRSRAAELLAAAYLGRND